MLWMSPPRNDVSHRLIECPLSTRCGHYRQSQCGMLPIAVSDVSSAIVTHDQLRSRKLSDQCIRSTLLDRESEKERQRRQALQVPRLRKGSHGQDLAQRTRSRPFIALRPRFDGLLSERPGPQTRPASPCGHLRIFVRTVLRIGGRYGRTGSAAVSMSDAGSLRTTCGSARRGWNGRR
jgi:hypothetical protein